MRRTGDHFKHFTSECANLQVAVADGRAALDSKFTTVCNELKRQVVDAASSLQSRADRERSETNEMHVKLASDTQDWCRTTDDKYAGECIAINRQLADVAAANKGALAQQNEKFSDRCNDMQSQLARRAEEIDSQIILAVQEQQAKLDSISGRLYSALADERTFAVGQAAKVKDELQVESQVMSKL